MTSFDAHDDLHNIDCDIQYEWSTSTHLRKQQIITMLPRLVPGPSALMYRSKSSSTALIALESFFSSIFLKFIRTQSHLVAFSSRGTIMHVRLCTTFKLALIALNTRATQPLQRLQHFFELVLGIVADCSRKLHVKSYAHIAPRRWVLRVGHALASNAALRVGLYNISDW